MGNNIRIVSRLASTKLLILWFSRVISIVWWHLANMCSMAVPHISSLIVTIINTREILEYNIPYLYWLHSTCIIQLISVHICVYSIWNQYCLKRHQTARPEERWYNDCWLLTFTLTGWIMPVKIMFLQTGYTQGHAKNRICIHCKTEM